MKPQWVLIIFFLFLVRFSPAQDADSVLLNTCNTAKDMACFTADEKQVIQLINFARTHPREFLNKYLADAGDQLHEQNSKEYKSLERELKNMKPVGLLSGEEALWKVAQAHALDMGKTGKTGHTSSKGKSFEARMGNPNGEIAENCDYGYGTPILIVCHLLIDKDVSGLGHRKNILNPLYKRVGTSIQPHKKYGMNCVMDFTQ
jgi:uncharacterized protein YkwD